MVGRTIVFVYHCLGVGTLLGVAGMVSVFISHRHADKEVATQIKTLMKDLNILNDSIFMSSEARHGIQPGEPIPDAIVSQIQQTDIFLLVYTVRGEEWSYCTYELGLAVASETKATTVVVMTLSGQLPDMVKHTKAIDLRNEEEIKEFVRLCCEEDDFLIRDEASRHEQQALLDVLKKVDQDVREQRADRLHEGLKPFVERVSEPDTIRHRMDYIALSVSPLTADFIESEENEEAVKARVLDEILADKTSDNHAFKIFGFANFQDGLTLKRLLESWTVERKGTVKRDLDVTETAWMDHVIDDVRRAVRGLNSRTSTNWFAGADDEGDANNLQLLTVQRKRETDGSILLGIYVYRYRAKPGEVPRGQHEA